MRALALLGFYFGGGRVMGEIALSREGVDPVTAVVVYPTRFHARGAGAGARCSVMAVFAEKDKVVLKAAGEEMQEGLGKNEVMEECEVMMFYGAGHAFAHDPKRAQDEDDSDPFELYTAVWFTESLRGGD